MTIEVPFRRMSEIEAMALDLLEKYQTWKESPLAAPIDVDEIIEGYFKIYLEFGDLKEHLSISDVLGAAWFDEKIIRIDSSLEEKEGRLSFTMAHEVGHWWMHRPIYEMGKLSLQLFSYDKSAPPSSAIVCRSTMKKEPAEWQADQFAGMLLMPASLMQESKLSVYGSEQIKVDGLEDYKNNSAQNPYLRAVAKKFTNADFNNVSVEAMCYRLISLGFVVDSNPIQKSLF